MPGHRVQSQPGIKDEGTGKKLALAPKAKRVTQDLSRSRSHQSPGKDREYLWQVGMSAGRCWPCSWFSLGLVLLKPSRLHL